MTMRWLSAIAAVVLALGVPRVARADSAEEARATQLFDEGRALAREGRCAEAIPIFLTSVKHVPGVGTFLNLGLCYEELGQTLTAHRWFVKAEELAVSRSDPRRVEARERAHALQQKLSRLTVRVAPGSEADLELKLDGEPLLRERWNVAEPVDPGVHEIRATSARRPTATLRVTVRPDAHSAEIVVPAIAASPRPIALDEKRTSTTTAVGWTLGGVGTGVLAVGGVFGILSIADHDSLVDRCPTYPTCAASQRSDLDGLNDSARTKGTVSTIAIIGGAVMLASGIVLLLTDGAR